MTQWSPRCVNTKWIYPPNTPLKIQSITPRIYAKIRENEAKSHFDNELSQIGFSLSNMDNDDALKNALTGKKIDHVLLKKSIEKLQRQFPIDEK